MGTNIGVRAHGDRKALERIAAKRGTTASAVVKKERARMRRLFGRGALYRATSWGREVAVRQIRLFVVARYNAERGERHIRQE